MTERDARIVVTAIVSQLKAAFAVAMADVRRDYELALLKATTTLGERLAAVEARPPQPGPAGADGAPGPAGPPGRDGVDGKAGLTYCGVFVDGRTYTRGDMVTYAGSMWHCHDGDMTTRPGDGVSGWTLMVKRGRDARRDPAHG